MKAECLVLLSENFELPICSHNQVSSELAVVRGHACLTHKGFVSRKVVLMVVSLIEYLHSTFGETMANTVSHIYRTPIVIGLGVIGDKAERCGYLALFGGRQ